MQSVVHTHNSTGERRTQHTNQLLTKGGDIKGIAAVLSISFSLTLLAASQFVGKLSSSESQQ